MPIIRSSLKLQSQPPVSLINAEVDVFPAVVDLLVSWLVNKLTTAGNTTTSTFILKPEAATSV
jgi:hypothetical protein